MNTNFHIILSFIVLLTTVACSNSIKNDRKEPKDQIDILKLHLVNDSIIFVDSDRINKSELNQTLIDKDLSQINKIFITAEKSVKMGSLTDIESIIGLSGIPLIIYPFKNDSIVKKLVEGSSKERLITFNLNNKGELFFDGNQINSASEIIPNIANDLKKIENPIVNLIPGKGTGYQDYIEKKEIINKELTKIDSTLKVSKGSSPYYKKIKE